MTDSGREEWVNKRNAAVGVINQHHSVLNVPPSQGAQRNALIAAHLANPGLDGNLFTAFENYFKASEALSDDLNGDSERIPGQAFGAVFKFIMDSEKPGETLGAISKAGHKRTVAALGTPVAVSYMASYIEGVQAGETRENPTTALKPDIAFYIENAATNPNNGLAALDRLLSGKAPFSGVVSLERIRVTDALAAHCKTYPADAARFVALVDANPGTYDRLHFSVNNQLGANPLPKGIAEFAKFLSGKTPEAEIPDEIPAGQKQRAGEILGDELKAAVEGQSSALEVVAAHLAARRGDAEVPGLGLVVGTIVEQCIVTDDYSSTEFGRAFDDLATTQPNRFGALKGKLVECGVDFNPASEREAGD